MSQLLDSESDTFKGQTVVEFNFQSTFKLLVIKFARCWAFLLDFYIKKNIYLNLGVLAHWGGGGGITLYQIRLETFYWFGLNIFQNNMTPYKMGFLKSSSKAPKTSLLRRLPKCCASPLSHLDPASGQHVLEQVPVARLAGCGMRYLPVPILAGGVHQVTHLHTHTTETCIHLECMAC